MKRACRTLVVALVLLLYAGRAAEGGKNVVLFVTDDQGLTAGCYGDKIIQTPNLDRLASEGTRFTNAFCATSSCSPSRSTILSGLYNHTSGQYGLQHAAHNFHTRPFVEGLPNLLRRAGYRTAIAGKYHVQPAEVYKFDAHLESGGNNVARMAASAERFIRESGDQPFFLYFCPTEPHRAKRGFGNDVSRPGLTPVRYDPAAIAIPAFLPNLPVVADELAEYYAAISRADQGLGLLLNALDAAGHADDTLVMFISDNGMPFPGAKTNLYDPGIHLPFVVRSPGQKRGVVCDAMVSWVDLVPTVLECTAARGPKYKLPGRSVLQILEQESPPGWDEIYATHTAHEVTMYYPMRAIRTRRHKLIMNIASGLPYPIAADLYGSRTWQTLLAEKSPTVGPRSMDAYVQRPRYELYDLEADPLEVKNLAPMPQHRETLARLQDRLRTWQTDTADPWLIKYTHE